MKKMDYFFDPKSVAIIGASRDPKNKPVTWFADNIVAFFSQRYTVGRLGAYEGSFERRKEKSGWAYRRRKNPAR